MRAKPQFRQYFILKLLDIRAHVSARSGSDSFFVFFFLSCHFSHPGLVGFGFLSRACARNPSFGNILSSGFFTFVPTVPREAFRRVFFALFILSFCRSRVLWVLEFCRVHAPEAAVLAPVSSEFDFPSCSKSLCSPENPCPNHNSVRVPRAYAHERIHAKSIVRFVFQVHTLTRASMPKPSERSCSKCIRSRENPCPNHNSVRVPRAYAHERTRAKTIITFVFQVHTLTREPMPKP